MDTKEKDNLEVLKDLLKYQGFGEDRKLHTALEQNLNAGKKEFSIEHEGKFKEQEKGVTANLHFRKSDQTGLVYFNKYDATVQSETDPSKNRSQTFYISKGTGVTLKEAFNLLEGRPVKRDLVGENGQKYNAWLQLDFSQRDTHNNYKMDRFTPGYGFDLPEKLGQLPIKFEFADGPQRLQKSLEKGNIAVVNYEHGGHTAQGMLSINAKFKTVNESKSLRDFRLQHFGQEKEVTEKQDKGEPAKKQNNGKRTKKEEAGEAVAAEPAQAPKGKRK